MLVLVRGMTHSIRMCRSEVVMPVKAFFETLAKHQQKSIFLRLDVNFDEERQKEFS